MKEVQVELFGGPYDGHKINVPEDETRITWGDTNRGLFVCYAVGTDGRWQHESSKPMPAGYET